MNHRARFATTAPLSSLVAFGSGGALVLGHALQIAHAGRPGGDRRRRFGRHVQTFSNLLEGKRREVVVVDPEQIGAEARSNGLAALERKVSSVSSSTVDVTRTNPQTDEDEDVSVTLTDSTTYRKVQSTTADAIAVGDCVRVSGKGSAKKGIKASTVAITGASSENCGQMGFGGGNGNTTPPSFPGGSLPNFGNGGGNGGTPPSLPNGAGNRRRPNAGNMTFGTVQSVLGDELVVTATVLPRRRNQQSSRGTPLKLKTRKVSVTLSDSTKITAPRSNMRHRSLQHENRKPVSTKAGQGH